MSVLQESQDLVAEAEDLHGFLLTLTEQDWSRPTAFKQWTPWDVVAHLHYYDRVSLLALEGEESFGPKRDELIAALRAGLGNAEIARREFGDLPPTELLGHWQGACHDLAGQLGRSDPKRRLPWFGPDMGVRMFTTARTMETWAHGQEVYDLMKVPRVYTDRIKNIAVIGIKTFAWTFVNRGLPVPGAPPHLRLVAPSGAIWEWNEPSSSECIRGDATDFCHVV
ncbi:MAG: maleylpyruvate isomerase family mycothiol-dependent enzyme, partial [Myxococcota bacterium]